MSARCQFSPPIADISRRAALNVATDQMQTDIVGAGSAKPGAMERSSGGDAVDRRDKGASVILVLNQYICIGCSPGKHPDIRTMAIGSDDDSRDSVHDRYLCIAV
jgi:hypothetical protein